MKITIDDLGILASDGCGYEVENYGDQICILVDDHWIEFEPHKDLEQMAECWERMVTSDPEVYAVIRCRRTRAPHVQIWRGETEEAYIDGDIDAPEANEIEARTMALIQMAKKKAKHD